MLSPFERGDLSSAFPFSVIIFDAFAFAAQFFRHALFCCDSSPVSSLLTRRSGLAVWMTLGRKGRVALGATFFASISWLAPTNDDDDAAPLLLSLSLVVWSVEEKKALLFSFSFPFLLLSLIVPIN